MPHQGLYAETLERLTRDGSDSAAAYLDGVGYNGHAVTLHGLEVGVLDYVYISRPVDGGVSVYERASSGNLSFPQEVND